jgi:hypothetical protein
MVQEGNGKKVCYIYRTLYHESCLNLGVQYEAYTEIESIRKYERKKDEIASVSYHKKVYLYSYCRIETRKRMQDGTN